MLGDVTSSRCLQSLLGFALLLHGDGVLCLVLTNAFFMAVSLLQGAGGYFSLKTVAGDQVSTIVCTIQIPNWPPTSLIVTLTGVVTICLLLVVFRYCCYRSKFWQASIPRIG